MSAAGQSGMTPVSIGTYLEEVATLLEGGFGRRHQWWLRGEISKFYEKDHLYVDVTDEGGGALLRVKCWKTTWQPLKASLAAQGLKLEVGSVITFKAYVDLYKPRGDLGAVISEIDVSGLLGDAERKRRELIEALRRDGVLPDKSAGQAPLPDGALRVGLIGSPGTEGFNDFLGQLDRSQMAFAVQYVATTVQGDAAPAAVVSALRQLDEVDLDVVCLVRGGGSKADLSCFDDERIARAIASSRHHVATGIGHTGDESIADLAAASAFATPTALGAALGEGARLWFDRRVTQPAARLFAQAQDVLDQAQQFVDATRREILSTARNRLTSEQRALASAQVALQRGVTSSLAAASQRVHTARTLLRAHDPARRLAQGWSIVTRVDGSVVTSVDDVRLGEGLSIRVGDGVIDGTVNEKRKEGK